MLHVAILLETLLLLHLRNSVKQHEVGVSHTELKFPMMGLVADLA